MQKHTLSLFIIDFSYGITLMPEKQALVKDLALFSSKMNKQSKMIKFG